MLIIMLMSSQQQLDKRRSAVLLLRHGNSGIRPVLRWKVDPTEDTPNFPQTYEYCKCA